MRTGGAQLGAALADLGVAGLDVGMKAVKDISNAEDAIEFSSMQRQANEIMNTAYLEASKAQDEKSSGAVLEAARKNVGELQSQRTEVNNRFQVYRNVMLSDWEKAWAIQSFNIKKRNLKASAEVNIQSALERFDLSGAKEQYDILKQYNIVSPAEYDEMVRNLPVDAVVAQAPILARTDPDEALATLDEKYFKDLTDSQLAKLHNATTHIRAIKNRKVTKDVEQQEADRLNMFERMYVLKTPVTWAIVADTALPSNEKIAVWNQYQAAQAELLTTGISRTEEGDPRVLAEIQELIDTRPTQLNAKMLWAATREWKKDTQSVLGTKYVSGLVNRLQQQQENKLNPIKSKYLQSIGQLHRDGLFGKTKLATTANTYLILRGKLEAFLDSVPTPTEEEARKFFAALVIEDARTFGRLGANELPGWDDTPIMVPITDKDGNVRDVEVRVGTIEELVVPVTDKKGNVSNEVRRMQAVGRKDGEVQWRLLKQQ